MNKFVKLLLLAAGLWVALAAAQVTAANGGDLAASFAAPPPAAARPWVYWMWMDGNLSRGGLTADLEAMQRAGIGGVIIMEVDVGIPKGPVKFMSAEWRQLFKHVVAEAERLGLQITLNAGPGWTGSGGPWVKPEQSMQHLVASAVEVSGPTNFNALLPRPIPRKPYFGTGGLPTELLKAQNEFYRDVAVLALPTPVGDERIADIDHKALYVRDPFSSMPGVKPFIPAPAEFPASPRGATIASGGILDLTDRLDSEGRLTWNAPSGNWTVMRFGRTSTGANTRPAPTPGLGLECDKFDKAALDSHYEHFVGALLRELGPDKRRDVGLTSLHIDSWEMGAQNWTANFREEFRRRRRYDPLRYLPAFTGRIVDCSEVSERFLWDVRQTAQELVIENHAQHLKELAHRHGMGLSIEPYDMNPTADLNLGAVADVPMCEFWANCFESWYSCFEAASIAHTGGKPIVAAESFTSDDKERWQFHPGSLKALGDWAFCSGVNRIVFHRYAHQPWLNRAPGMTMGPYGVHWERTQTWWAMVTNFHEYLARCQFMLRQGVAVADILYLTAEGAPQVFRPPQSALRGNPPDHLEYNFDACSPETLRARATVKRGRIVFPGGTSYRLLALPNVDTMTPGLLRKVKELAQAGATIAGTPPRKSPSLANYPQCDAEVQNLAREIWGAFGVPALAGRASQPPEGGTPNRQRRLGKGRIVWSTALTNHGGTTELPADAAFEIYPDYAALAVMLRADGLPPDFESDGPLRYTHRHDGNTEIYFLANRSAETCITTAAFRVSGKAPELWNPLTREIRRAQVWQERDGRTFVPLKLEAHDSVFVVFRHSANASSAKASGRNWDEFAPVQEIKGPWEVRFQPGRGAPEQPSFETLADWSKHADPGVKYFSGMATYRNAFNWKPENSQPSTLNPQLFLDLGHVEVMARVKINGKDAGTVWKSPFRVNINGSLKSGENQLEITVANLWPNRLIGDAALPKEQRVAWTTWNPFAKDTPLLESGLLGPVTIVNGM
ncbi:MAG: glycosyl hydrolase [Verrucomicrobia bacterium]|nr:glycosyl hydrolase [Verrucomicrobiota bacterium]